MSNLTGSSPSPQVQCPCFPTNRLWFRSWLQHLHREVFTHFILNSLLIEYSVILLPAPRLFARHPLLHPARCPMFIRSWVMTATFTAATVPCRDLKTMLSHKRPRRLQTPVYRTVRILPDFTGPTFMLTVPREMKLLLARTLKILEDAHGPQPSQLLPGAKQYTPRQLVPGAQQYKNNLPLLSLFPGWTPYLARGRSTFSRLIFMLTTNRDRVSLG